MEPAKKKYVFTQLGKIGCDSLKIKLVGDRGESNYLSISFDQYKAIRDILTGDKQDNHYFDIDIID